jgi:hypothetical protein
MKSFRCWFPGRFLCLLALLHISAILPIMFPLPATSKDREVPDKEDDMVYIIEFTDKSLSAYSGGIADYPPTAPSQTGKKLDFNHPAVIRYHKYLENKSSLYLANINRTLNRQVGVIKSFNVSLFGVAVEIKPEEAVLIGKLPGIKQIKPDEMRFLLQESE